MEKSKVYFTKTITKEKVVEMFDVLNKELKGNIAIKIHSGERGNQNFLKPEFWKPIIDKLGGTVVECNTAYPGSRNHTDIHRRLIKDHGWDKYFAFDLMDAEGPDMVRPVHNGFILKENYVGKSLKNYDSMIVLAHFKGHPCAGYGGALKQLSIGVASTQGKALIHSASKTNSQDECWGELMASQKDFCESMADAAESVVSYFNGNIAYISVMKNISIDCDCCSPAEDPCMEDIGILSSLDPVAIDQACIDLIYSKTNDKGQKHFLERLESLGGIHTVEAASKLGYGNRVYKLIEIK